MVGWLKFNIIEKMPFMVYLEIQCITFKTEKNLLSPTPGSSGPLLALRNIQLMTGEPRHRYNALQLLGVSGACDHD